MLWFHYANRSNLKWGRHPFSQIPTPKYPYPNTSPHPFRWQGNSFHFHVPTICNDSKTNTPTLPILLRCWNWKIKDGYYLPDEETLSIHYIQSWKSPLAKHTTIYISMQNQSQWRRTMHSEIQILHGMLKSEITSGYIHFLDVIKAICFICKNWNTSFLFPNPTKPKTT